MFTGRDSEFAAVLSSMLLDQSLIGFRGLIPVILHPFVTTRRSLFQPLFGENQTHFFGQPILAILCVFLVAAGVKMGRLDAAAPMAKMEDKLALRGFASAYFKSNAVSLSGSVAS